MMKSIKYVKYLILGCIIFSFFIDLIAFPFFNRTIAIQFDSLGNVNGEMHKLGVFIIPILMICILCIKDNGKKIFLNRDYILANPYKIVIGVVGTILCTFANIYIVAYNLNFSTIFAYHLLQCFIIIFLIMIIAILIKKIRQNKSH